MLAGQNHALVLGQLFLHHGAEHALSELVEVAQGFVKALAHLGGDHRRTDHLRVWMLQAGASPNPMVLEDGDVGNPWVLAYRAKALAITLQKGFYLLRGKQRKGKSVVRGLDDHIMDANPADGAPRAFDLPLRLAFPDQCGELVRYHAHAPPAVQPGKAQDLGRRQVFIAGTEGTGFHVMRELAPLALDAHLFRALGALGGHDHPLLGEAVLAQLGHGRAG